MPPLITLPLSADGQTPLPGLAEVERPIGEWNELEVACVGRAVAVRLNGRVVNREGPVPSVAGPVGLAPQGCEIEFRNVGLQEIRR